MTNFDYYRNYKNFDNLLWKIWDTKYNSVRFKQSPENNGFKLLVDVPGYDKNNIKISFENNVLKIEGDLENREFEYEWDINQSKIDMERIKAKVDKGLLEVLLPYNTKKNNDFRIEIE